MKQILQPELDDGVQVSEMLRYSSAATNSTPKHPYLSETTMTPTRRPHHLNNHQQHAPAIVTCLLSDHQLTHGDALGRHKRLGGGDRKLPPGTVFGCPSAREPEPCVAELIRCGYSEEEQQPDADLGKTLHEGWRTAATVAGGEPGWAASAGAANCAKTEVPQLLAPPRSAELGVGTAQMAALRSREEMAGLVAAAGLVLEAEGFDEVFSAAAGAEGGGSDHCSLAGFLDFRQQLLRGKLAM